MSVCTSDLLCLYFVNRFKKSLKFFGPNGLMRQYITVFKGRHFILWMIDYSKRSTTYFNSYGPEVFDSCDTVFAEKIHAFLYAREQWEIGSVVGTRPWTVRKDGINTSIQKGNSTECGVFVIKFMDCLINGTDPNTLQLNQMSMFRKNILFELANHIDATSKHPNGSSI